MSSTELTILFDFHTIRMIFLILGRIIVSLLALCTSKCYLCTHNSTSIVRIRLENPKKKDSASFNLPYSSTLMRISQVLFFWHFYKFSIF